MESLTQEQRMEVRTRYATLEFPDPVLEPVWFRKRPEFRIDGKKAIVDQNTNTVVGICSDQYRVVHYEDIIKMVEDSVAKLPEFGTITVEPNIIADGGKMSIKALMGDTKYEIKKDDFVNPQITIRTSYDLGWKYISMFGAFRIEIGRAHV